MAQADSGTSGSVEVVRVQLLLQRRKDDAGGPWPKEVVRRCTSKGNEVVDVDGFTFVRKRKAEQEPPRAEPGAGAAAQQEEQQPAGAACDAGGTQADGTEGQPQLGQQGEAPAPASPGVDCADAGTAAGPCVPECSLADEVAGLLQYIPAGACPTAAQAAWLVERALQLAARRAGGGEGAAAEAVQLAAAFSATLEEQVAAARALLQQGGLEQVRQFEQLPPMLREQCASERLAAELRQQLQDLQQEEQAWLKLEGKYNPQGQAELRSEAPQAAPAAAQDAVAATAGPALLERLGVPAFDSHALESAKGRANLELGFQVEAVTNMIDKTERLVERAERACALLQADYHKENFQAFPHVNSPQVLVKLLSQL